MNGGLSEFNSQMAVTITVLQVFQYVTFKCPDRVNCVRLFFTNLILCLKQPT